MNPTIKKSLFASSIALAFGTTGANASLATNVYGPYTWSTDSANFTMLDPNGYVTGDAVGFGGTNDVTMMWDGNAYNASSDYVGPGSPSNIIASSTTPFFNQLWTAHDIQVFTPGSYTFDTSLDGGSPESGIMTMNVGANQLGMHMLFDWGGSFNIDMVVVFNKNSVFGSGKGISTHPGCNFQTPSGGNINCLYDLGNFGSAGQPNASNPWMLSSTDQAGGDGIMGTPMAAGGPFQFYNANFNANLAPSAKVVPVPAAAWLFGSGVMGIAAAVRRRKKV